MNTLSIRSKVNNYINTHQVGMFDIVTITSIAILAADILWLMHDIHNNGLNWCYMTIGIVFGVSQFLNVIVLVLYHKKEKARMYKTSEDISNKQCNIIQERRTAFYHKNGQDPLTGRDI